MTVHPGTCPIVNRVKVLSYFAVVGQTVVITALGLEMLHLGAGASAAHEAKKFILEQVQSSQAAAANQVMPSGERHCVEQGAHPAAP